MDKHFFIYDFDNTVYPVSSIGNKLFAPLFRLIEDEGKHSPNIKAIKDEIMRKPFQKIADKYRFSNELTQRSLELLRELTYDEKIEVFQDYECIKQIPGDRFLVTMGFLKMQRSKIKASGIEPDFKEVIIVDPETTDKTKKDIFEEIILKYDLKYEAIVVVGDDPESELKAAEQLGLTSVLYDKENRHPDYSKARIDNFAQLREIIT